MVCVHVIVKMCHQRDRRTEDLGSHLNKKLLQILLELFGVSGDGYRANICVVRHSNHQIFQTHRSTLYTHIGTKGNYSLQFSQAKDPLLVNNKTFLVFAYLT